MTKKKDEKIIRQSSIMFLSSILWLGRDLSKLVSLDCVKLKRALYFKHTSHNMNVVSGSLSSSTFDNDSLSPMIQMDLSKIY
jgi:hypothetical protein